MSQNERSIVRIYTVIVLLFAIGMVNTSPLQAQNADLTWHSMDDAQALAKKNGKKILVYAVTSWCVYCKKMDKNVLSRPAVIDSLDTYFYPVKVNIESKDIMRFNGQDITSRQFAYNHNVRATPTTLFMDENGNIMGRQPGYVPADMFSMLLAFMGSDAFLKMDFKMYIKKSRAAANN